MNGRDLLRGLSCFDAEDDADIAFQLATPSDHTMGNTLTRYVDGKIHEQLGERRKITLVPSRQRSGSVVLSKREKRDKLFNWQRPALELVGKDQARLHVFPGRDYLLHYGLLVEAWHRFNGKRPPDVIVKAVTKAETWNALDLDLIVHPTVIMGYVEPVRAASSDWSAWEGTGAFQVSHHGNGGVSLLGCKHSYWGDIAGVLLWKLSRLGVRRLLYVGKLGSLRDDLMPNETLVTGTTSLIGGVVVDWSESDFGRELTDVQRVRHVHLPSTMLETRAWAVKARTIADVVDPEIGHLGRSALDCGLSFGYLHLVTDNLLEVTGVGLHNERRTILSGEDGEVWLAAIGRSPRVQRSRSTRRLTLSTSAVPSNTVPSTPHRDFPSADGESCGRAGGLRP